MVCITATIGKKRHKKVVWANCLVNARSLRVTQLGPRAQIELDRDGISFHNWHALLWDTVHIFSQERQTRGEPRRLVRRVPSSVIPVLATDKGHRQPILRTCTIACLIAEEWARHAANDTNMADFLARTERARRAQSF